MGKRPQLRELGDYPPEDRYNQAITITSFVREFRGPDAYIECRMVDNAGKDISHCLMIVTFVDKTTKRGIDWPADIMALFFEEEQLESS